MESSVQKFKKCYILDIFGISDHDLMYSQEDVVTEDEIAVSGSHEAIQARVSKVLTWECFSLVQSIAFYPTKLSFLLFQCYYPRKCYRYI